MSDLQEFQNINYFDNMADCLSATLPANVRFFFSTFQLVNDIVLVKDKL